MVKLDIIKACEALVLGSNPSWCARFLWPRDVMEHALPIRASYRFNSGRGYHLKKHPSWTVGDDKRLCVVHYMANGPNLW